MVIVKQVSAKITRDSRGDKTIFVMIRVNSGTFSASSPNGKSRGKKEAKPYKKNLEGDIKTLKKFSDYFSQEKIDCFKDLEKIEDIIKDQVGANTLFALESCVLKALAKEKKKEVWELLGSKSNTQKGTSTFPRLAGNLIGGGKHSSGIKGSGKKPDFQEFLLIPNLNSVKQSQETNKKIKEKLKIILREEGKNFHNEKTDEDGWKTSLNEKEVFEILSDFKIPIGTDIAASSFYKRKKYHYENPLLKRNEEEQLSYISNLIKNFNLFYIEDPFHEEDFTSFSKLLKKFPDRLIVGDDLVVTNLKRLEKAIKSKSVNAIIVKPNQIGSLLEVKEVCELAKRKNIKTIFSHRSGETEENIIADLAFGLNADFIKTGITGKEREAKINRLIEIQKSLN
jgi:enolase